MNKSIKIYKVRKFNIVLIILITNICQYCYLWWLSFKCGNIFSFLLVKGYVQMLVQYIFLLFWNTKTENNVIHILIYR